MSHRKDLCVNFRERKRIFSEMMLRDMGEDRFNIIKIKKVLKIIDKYKKQNMFLII